MTYCQCDVPECASEPDVPGTSLDECIPVLASLEDGHCGGIIRKEVDKLASEFRCPDFGKQEAASASFSDEVIEIAGRR